MKRFEGKRFNQDGSMYTICLDVQGGKIVRIQTYDEVDESLPLMIPGFIDIHVHGGGGADTMDATKEAFHTIAQTHAKHGTTSLLLTTVTESVEAIDKVLRNAKDYMTSSSEDGSGILGLHLEGPFIHPEKCGAQRQDMIVEPNPLIASRWFNSGIVKMMTMAPERPQALEVARLARSKGVIVSAGHTTAGTDQLYLAREAGFSHITHLCNAMEPFLHRNIGPIGHIIEDDYYTGDMICDGIHLAAAMVKALIKSIGPNRLMLITDAMRAVDLGAGTYDLGGLRVSVEDGICRLPDGKLAGSVLTMGHAFTMVQKLAGVTPWIAEQMASTNPANKLGLGHKGKIEEGFDADLVFMDTGGNVIQTVVNGKTVFEK